MTEKLSGGVPPKIKDKRLIRNAARCKKCGTLLESKHRHDFAACPCGNFIDGGLEYERGGGDPRQMENLCEYEEYERAPFPHELRDASRMERQQAGLNTAMTCPSCAAVVLFKCPKCGEEFYDHNQSLASSAEHNGLKRAAAGGVPEQGLRDALERAAVRLEIVTARMRGCNEETGKHELLDEAEMFCAEARAALERPRPAPHPEDVRDADAALDRLCPHGVLKTLSCADCARPALPPAAPIGWQTCPLCLGRGMVTFNPATPTSTYSADAGPWTCPACGGQRVLAIDLHGGAALPAEHAPPEPARVGHPFDPRNPTWGVLDDMADHVWGMFKSRIRPGAVPAPDEDIPLWRDEMRRLVAMVFPQEEVRRSAHPGEARDISNWRRIRGTCARDPGAVEY